MEGRSLLQGSLIFSRHPLRRKDDNLRDIRLKNVQTMVDLAFVGDNHSQRTPASTALQSGFLQFCRKAKPDIVAFQAGVPDQYRICGSALPKQVHLILSGSEIDRGQIFRGDLPIDSHGEGSENEWTSLSLFHANK